MQRFDIFVKVSDVALETTHFIGFYVALDLLFLSFYLLFLWGFKQFTFCFWFLINALKSKLLIRRLLLEIAGIDLFLNGCGNFGLFVLLLLIKHFQIHSFLWREFLRALETRIQSGRRWNLRIINCLVTIYYLETHGWKLTELLPGYYIWNKCSRSRLMAGFPLLKKGHTSPHLGG